MKLRAWVPVLATLLLVAGGTQADAGLFCGMGRYKCCPPPACRSLRRLRQRPRDEQVVLQDRPRNDLLHRAVHRAADRLHDVRREDPGAEDPRGLRHLLSRRVLQRLPAGLQHLLPRRLLHGEAALLQHLLPHGLLPSAGRCTTPATRTSAHRPSSVLQHLLARRLPHGPPAGVQHLLPHRLPAPPTAPNRRPATATCATPSAVESRKQKCVQECCGEWQIVKECIPGRSSLIGLCGPLPTSPTARPPVMLPRPGRLPAADRLQAGLGAEDCDPSHHLHPDGSGSPSLQGSATRPAPGSPTRSRSRFPTTCSWVPRDEALPGSFHDLPLRLAKPARSRFLTRPAAGPARRSPRRSLATCTWTCQTITKKVPYTTCSYVNETRTRRVPCCVPRTVCETSYVCKTRCVPHTVCVTKARCVPKVVCRRVPVDPCCPVDPGCAAPMAACDNAGTCTR